MINDHNGIPFAPPIDAAAVDIFIASRDNPLLKFAKPVLLLAAPLRHLAAGADVKALRRYAIQEIRAFEEHARQCALLHDDISEASWALCALLDEAVFNSSSSANTDWYFQSLLITIHLELRSEIKFFDVLDRLLTDPRHHLQLLELWYLCIALGYVGKYRSDPGGAPALTAIRSDLYQRIQSLRQLT
jgi:type VI secretion system protein ImpK